MVYVALSRGILPPKGQYCNLMGGFLEDLANQAVRNAAHSGQTE